jgi:hypothetical protein
MRRDIPFPGPDLPAGVTCQYRVGDRVLFASGRRWLHPLFDLGDHLGAAKADPQGLLVDTIIGRGAAFLIARLGLANVRTRLVSRLAIPVLDAHGVAWSAGAEVERVLCATEAELADVTDVEEACRLLARRRERAG